MKIIDVYTPFLEALLKGQSIAGAIEATRPLSPFASQAEHWSIDLHPVERAMLDPGYGAHAARTALPYLQEVQARVAEIEATLCPGRELPGELHLVPSLGAFDGFARYDRGHHRVLLGIDFPDADLNYLRALTAHELSHVYRDHQPRVWGHLGKPLEHITRAEYLDAVTAREHLVSEGVATLFSQLLYPEIPHATHHYYEPHEWDWCVNNHEQIEEALFGCLHPPGDENVWRFYGEGEAGPGSPSRTQYFWAAHRIREWLPDFNLRSLVIAHGWEAERFECFEPGQKKR
jgi:hypothetical protein